MFKKISFLLASWFKVGYSPKASGTCGSLAALPFIMLFTYFFGFIGAACFAAVTLIIGYIVSKEVLKYTEHDPSLIVIDEVCGQTITFLSVAFVLHGDFSVNTWWIYAAGFGLFRLFDILKPSIIGKIDREMRNASGVMLDDVMAGIFASAVLWGLVGGVQMTMNYLNPSFVCLTNSIGS
jgi:phosphatidylglycerophosphatase A